MSQRTLQPYKPQSQRSIERARKRQQKKLSIAVHKKYREAVEESLMDAAGEPVAARSEQLGLAVTQSSSGKVGVRKVHFGFWRDRWRVADYWATTQTLRIAGKIHRIETLPEALEIVASILGPATSSGPHGPLPKRKSRGRHYPRPTALAEPRNAT